MERELTGRHVLIGFVAAFSVIISVNLVLAYSAVKTFPGLEVKNSYVASQEFDVRRDAQLALGWTVRATHSASILSLSITDANGAPVEVAELEATVGRATHVYDDIELQFRFDGSEYFAVAPLRRGNWNVRMLATAQDGTQFQQRVVLIKK